MPSFQVEETEKMNIEGASSHRELRAPMVICVDSDTPASAFVEAAVWLHKNPEYTLIGVASHYYVDEPGFELLLTVE
jgi:hypothetical protein